MVQMARQNFSLHDGLQALAGGRIFALRSCEMLTTP
jgi:hypothetical protein